MTTDTTHDIDATFWLGREAEDERPAAPPDEPEPDAIGQAIKVTSIERALPYGAKGWFSPWESGQ